MAAACLALVMPLVAFSAPLLHVHPDEHATDHHQGGTVHAHFHSHEQAPAGPVVDHEDTDRAIQAQVFVAVTPDPPEAPAAPAHSFVVVVAQDAARGRSPQVTHGHDPPILASHGPRPPPAFHL